MSVQHIRLLTPCHTTSAETATIDINLGNFELEDTIKTCLIPVTPSLEKLQEGGKHGDDVFGTAMSACRAIIEKNQMISADGDVIISDGIYRYFVAQK